MSIPRDVQEFLEGYPGVDDDDPTCQANFEFYSNNTRCIPDNRTIEEIHERLPATYIPCVICSLINLPLGGLVIMIDWSTDMDIYSGCRCTLLLEDHWQSFQSLAFLDSPSENME